MARANALKKRVYIETTIPGFYHEVRQEPEIIARRIWTRKWWDEYASHFELVTSQAVLDELQEGDYPNQSKIIALLRQIPLIPVEEEIGVIIEAYIRHHIMPHNPTGDALHLALASYHKCDFLLTWNCNHLANANKFSHIRAMNTRLGLFIPTLTTPLELMR